MTDYQSIYTNHYEGETYRFGVSYLREEPADHVADLYAEKYPSLDEQRRIIEQLAQEAQTLIIAEFIDRCGQSPAEEREGITDLFTFWHNTHPQVLFAASEDVLGFNTHDNFFVEAELMEGGPEVITTDR
ncbi:hypothetical protein ICM05_08690 [Leucobacter sp. cx-42]|uniref:hypothetical protein n=1 Tax=unclassified Leucobacter TaxID=2621730 RepID=UPI00165D87DE|nr:MULTISPECIES: hypothetical protein [unclassified Leucobacter]MBC9954719.1 hypothetical protein [Leucobacter sp. cx-42]